MVCGKCEKKLAKVITPDKWKAGARNSVESGGRAMGTNTLLKKKERFAPYSKICKTCKGSVHQENSVYCHMCAYKNGICAMCGEKILDTKMLKMSST